MTRIAIMVRLAGGGTAHSSYVGGSDEPQLYPVLSQARVELQTTLQDVGRAVHAGHMNDDYPVTDHFLHDTQTGRSYELAWAPEKNDLLVRISHAEALAQVVRAVAEDGCSAEERAFQFDVAKTALEFGLMDHGNTVAVLLPSQDGPNWDKHAIAPSSMAGAVAIAFVDQACARANALQAAIDEGELDDDEGSVSERIDAYLEEAGFTVLSNDEGNLRVAKPWDAYEPEIVDQPSSSPAP